MTTASVPNLQAGFRRPGLVSQISAEWTKLSSTKAFYIQVGLSLLLAVGMSALIGLAIGSTWTDFTDQQKADYDPVFISFTGTAFSGIVITVMGTTLVSSEYTSGMMRLTMAVTPSRGRVLAAKGIVIAAVTLLLAMPVVVGSFLAGQAVLGAYEGVPTVTLSESDARRAIVAAWLTAPLFPLLGMALGAILRSTAPAITASMALIFAPAIFGGLLPDVVQKNVLAYLPGNASDTLLRTDTDYLTYLEPVAAIAVLLAWLAVAFGSAYMSMRRRDV